MGTVSKRKPLTDAEVADFAKRIYRNEIFVSWMMPRYDDHLLPMVFMPLVFLTDEQRQEMIDDGSHFLWAQHGHNVPTRYINGYPMFYEMGTWTKDEGLRIHALLVEIETAMENL